MAIPFTMKKKEAPGSLVYVSDTMPGYYRTGEKGNFHYTNKIGKEITDEKIIERINDLVIPPDWRNVWICRKPRGHIQVTGRDSKGRKQYIYHPKWQEHLSRRKYENLKEFGEKLPEIRQQLQTDLRKRTWDKRKVTALAINLLDELYLRVGNKFYEEENGTYGLTTLRKKHLIEDKKYLLLKYKAKKGKLRKVKVSHPTLRKLLKKCSELPGYELFRYKEGNNYYPIDSQDINDYLHEVSSIGISAKNFRTWGGTVLTVKMVPEAQAVCEQNPRKKLETTLVGMVAKELNNTVSVCRKYYIHPDVLEIAVKNQLEQFQPDPEDERLEWYDPEEIIVLNILNSINTE